MMGCSLKFRVIVQEPRFVSFNKQIRSTREKIEEKYYPLFKSISRQKGIEIANSEISQRISQDYKYYMEQQLEGNEAHDAFEFLTYFMTFNTPLNSIFINQNDMQMMQSSDFVQDIGRLVEDM
jgi:hypothetical protein